MRLIDADELLEDLKQTYDCLQKTYEGIPTYLDKCMCYAEISSFKKIGLRIKAAPTIGEEHVRHDGTTTFIETDDIDKFQSRVILTENKKSKFCRVFYEDDREHGRWVPVTCENHPKIMLGCTGYMCSECGRIEEENSEPYCHCGAKMDLK